MRTGTRTEPEKLANPSGLDAPSGIPGGAFACVGMGIRGMLAGIEKRIAKEG